MHTVEIHNHTIPTVKIKILDWDDKKSLGIIKSREFVTLKFRTRLMDLAQIFEARDENDNCMCTFVAVMLENHIPEHTHEIFNVPELELEFAEHDSEKLNVWISEYNLVPLFDNWELMEFNPPPSSGICHYVHFQKSYTGPNVLRYSTRGYVVNSHSSLYSSERIESSSIPRDKINLL